MKSAFHDLPARDFPLVIEAFDLTDQVVWQQRVVGPGSLYIPPLADDHGPVRIKITYADGRVSEASPPGY